MFVLSEIFHTVAKMFIIHAASEWLYWRKHQYLKFQQKSKHRFSSDIAMHIPTPPPLPALWVPKTQKFDYFLRTNQQNLFVIIVSRIRPYPSIFEYEPKVAWFWSCISNPIQADHPGYVGSHYNRAQEHNHQIWDLNLLMELLTSPVDHLAPLTPVIWTSLAKILTNESALARKFLKRSDRIKCFCLHLKYGSILLAVGDAGSWPCALINLQSYWGYYKHQCSKPENNQHHHHC